MEGWEDDGWEAFDSSQAAKVKSERPPATLSSGADFFETFETTKKMSTGKSKSGDFFDMFEDSRSTKTAKVKTPPPPVSPSLFASGRDKTGVDEGDGWGNWDEDLTPSKQVSKITSFAAYMYEFHCFFLTWHKNLFY